MAAQKPPFSSRAPGLIPPPVRVAFKGKLHIAWNTAQQAWVARSWPRDNGGTTPARAQSIAQFKQMVEAARTPAASMKAEAEALSKKTLFTWRDLLQMAATGRLHYWYDDTGKLWMGWRMANETIQVLLDSILNTVGCMLIRTPRGWEALLPPATLKTLNYDPAVGFPQWGDIPTDVQDVLDQLGTTTGDIIIRHSTGWTIVDPTTLFDAAGAAAAALVTAEAYTDSKVAGAGAPYHPGFVSGRWYSVAETAESSLFMNANQIYTMPFYVPNAHTFTGIGMHVSGAAAAGKLCELGIYANNGGQPGAREYDCGNVAVSTTGDKTIVGLTLALTAGWHFLAVASNGNPSITSISNNGSYTGAMLLGRTNIGDVNSAFINVAWTFSAGALPNPFGTAAYGAAGGPMIVLKG